MAGTHVPLPVCSHGPFMGFCTLPLPGLGPSEQIKLVSQGRHFVFQQPGGLQDMCRMCLTGSAIIQSDLWLHQRLLSPSVTLACPD